MIELTSAAAQQILASAGHHGEGYALRIAAWPAQDGSVEYGMGFDQEREGDLALSVEGVDLLIGVPSRVFLLGTVLDFVEYAPGDYRFIFIPPAAEEACAPQTSCSSGGCSGCRGA
jgi:iron-sulfur cluster assembly protein